LEEFATLRGTIFLSLKALSVLLGRQWMNSAVWTVLLRQIYFSAFQPIGIVIFVALASGAVIVHLIITSLAIVGAKDMIGKVIIFVVVEELAPLISTFILLLRSGPAVVSELSIMKLNKEFQSIDALDINIYSYLFMPRMAALIVSNIILGIVVCFVSLIGGFLVLGSFHNMIFQDYLRHLVNGAGLIDLMLFVKLFVFGYFVAAGTVYSGSNVKKAFTEVPIALIKGFVNITIYILIAEIVIDGIYAVL